VIPAGIEYFVPFIDADQTHHIHIGEVKANTVFDYVVGVESVGKFSHRS